MPMTCTTIVMLTNIAPSSVPMVTSVRRAFFHSGGLNAGTPSLIASTPVSALLPDANACRMRNSDSAGITAVTGVG